MKIEFIDPSIEILNVEPADVIATSGWDPDDLLSKDGESIY